MARVLVVEDNAENLRLTVFLLRAFGHTPLEARSAEEGIRLVRSERPDLVLMDIQMPEMDGFDALGVIRGDPNVASTRVVALTALAMVGDREAGIAAGFDGYITKPLDPERFAETIDPFLPPGLRSLVPAGIPPQRSERT